VELWSHSVCSALRHGTLTHASVDYAADFEGRLANFFIFCR